MTRELWAVEMLFADGWDLAAGGRGVHDAKERALHDRDKLRKDHSPSSAQYRVEKYVPAGDVLTRKEVRAAIERAISFYCSNMSEIYATQKIRSNLLRELGLEGKS